MLLTETTVFLDVEDQTMVYMTLKQYWQYFASSQLPPELKVDEAVRPGGVTYNLLALPLFPEDAYGKDFTLPYLASQ